MLGGAKDRRPPVGPVESRLMEGVDCTPRPGLLAAAREAGCLDEPAAEQRPGKKRKERDYSERPVPPPWPFCTYHPSTPLDVWSCRSKASPNCGRKFCACHAFWSL